MSGTEDSRPWDNRTEAERLADIGAEYDAGRTRDDLFLEAQARATLAAVDALRRIAEALESFTETPSKGQCSPTCNLSAGHPGPHHRWSTR